MTLIDTHVHFFSPKVFGAIWRYFEETSRGLWKIRYQLCGRDLVTGLDQFGVTRFTTLVYAHKPGLADYLNQYVYRAAQEFPQIIPFGTVYSGDKNVAIMARKIFKDYGFYGVKLHPFVSRESLDDPGFFPLYEIMQELGKVLICHAGSGPAYEDQDGARRLGRVLDQFPHLKVVIAHCGAFEYGDYAALADTFASFPNIPYEYCEQIDAIKRMELGPEIESKIFCGNAAQLFGI